MRKHSVRRMVVGAAATTSGVVLLLALKQPSATVTASAQPGGAGAAGAAAEGRTVLGDAADTPYGAVQVRLTLSEGGRIVAAQAVKAPDGEARSRQIAQDAIPELNRAVVAAQSADIDAVSGASYTSEGYLTSLQSALDKAAAAGAASGAGAEAGAEAAGGAAEEDERPEEDGGTPTEPADGADDGGGAADDGGAAGGGEAGNGDGAGGSPQAGTVLGDVADTPYGPVQVRITVSGGRVTAAEAVQTPSGNPNSESIAASAVPELNRAAVAAQSADIDAVSGASYTSEGYITSLQSALDEAGV